MYGGSGLNSRNIIYCWQSLRAAAATAILAQIFWGQMLRSDFATHGTWELYNLLEDSVRVNNSDAATQCAPSFCCEAAGCA